LDYNYTNEIVISLGTNLGNKKDNLEKAISLLKVQLEIVKFSNIYESEAWGFKSKNTFLNMGILVNPTFNALKLLKFLKHIEISMGRIFNNKKGYSDRIIDLDILLYGDQIINTPNLKIPHVKIAERKFSILIIKDLLGESLLPIFKKTASTMLLETTDRSNISIFDG